jgi:hypothetical protein
VLAAEEDLNKGDGGSERISVEDGCKMDWIEAKE